MANQKTVAFSLKVDGVDKAIQSIDDLDNAIIQLEDTLKQAEFGSEQFKSLEEQLIKARSAKEDLDKQLEGRGAEKRLQGIIGLAEGIGGAFAIASTASALFGKESEQLAKVEQKAQQAIAVVMGIRAIKEGLLNSAMERRIILEKAAAAGTVILNTVNKALNITLTANPIGLIVTAIGLLVVGIAAAIGPIKKFIQQFDFLGDAIQWTIDRARDLASVLSFGLIDDSTTAKTRDNANKAIEALDDVNSASNRTIAAEKRKLQILEASGASEKAILEQKKKIYKADIAAKQAAVDSLTKLYKKTGELSEDEMNKLKELREAIKDVKAEMATDEASFQKEQREKAAEAAKERQEKAKEAAQKAKEEREKVLELEREVQKKIKALKDQEYLNDIKDQQERARETLRIQQEAADAEIQVQIDALNKKKKLTDAEVKLKESLIAQQKELDVVQGQETQALLDAQAKERAEKEKAYNKELMDIKNQLTLMSIQNQEERAKKELEIQLAQQIEEINSRQLTEEQKTALIVAATEMTALKVAEIEKTQAQQVKDFKFGLLEEGFEKQLLTVDLEKEAKLQQLATLKLSEEESAAARVEIERQAAKAKEDINRAVLMQQLDGTAQVLGDVAGLFGEETGAFKAFKIAETGISTYSSAQKAFESMAGIPVVGPVLGAIAAAAAVASGLKTIGKIAGIGVPNEKVDKPSASLGPSKFAMGGLVTGPGTGTSDSVPAMLSSGESVINAASTQMFGGLLSAINQAGGGRPIDNGGQQPIFRTYVVASEMTSQQEADKRIQDIARI